jgi:hypothetical protein
MIAPPLTAERLLEGLSTKTDFRDGILGDLAEEFAERAEIDGVATARRWYYREAFRAMPHLLLDWARSLRLRDVRRLANVLFASYFLVTMLVGLLLMMTRGALDSLGITPDFLVVAPRPVLPAVGLTLGAASAVLAGYVAASLDKKTPLASAIALGLLWSFAGIAMSFIFGTPETTWYRLAATIVMVAGTTIGGTLHIRNARFTPDVA